jgi:hypothetical protein
LAALVAWGGCGDDSSGETDAAVVDAAVPDGALGPGLSTLACELTERPGAIPQPPMTLVADFGAPERLGFDDPCPQDAIEVSPDGDRIYHHYTTNLLDVLIAEGRQLAGSEVRFHERGGDGAWGPGRVLDLRRGDPEGLAGETRVARDGSWVIWHALSPMNYGYVDGLPPGQGFDLDLYEAPMVNGVPAPGTHLGREVNSAYLEGEHWASDDGRDVYFASNRPGGEGGLDLWKVSRDAGGAWGAAAPLPAPVNTADDELQPTFSPDGQWIYFTSGRAGARGIWRVPVLAAGGYGAAAEQVIAPYAGEPSFADDGRLFFVHVEIDFAVTPPLPYDADVYVASPR